MHEHGCALYGSTISVASASDKTDAYQNIFVADFTASSFTFRSALWTVTRVRTGYANVIIVQKPKAGIDCVVERKIFIKTESYTAGNSRMCLLILAIGIFSSVAGEERFLLR